MEQLSTAGQGHWHLLGHEPRLVVPISTSPNRISNVTAPIPDEMMLSLPETLELQGRSVMLITAHLDAAGAQAGIVEPLTATRTGLEFQGIS